MYQFKKVAAIKKQLLEKSNACANIVTLKKWLLWGRAYCEESSLSENKAVQETLLYMRGEKSPFEK